MITIIFAAMPFAHRPDEPGRAAADRRARRGVPLPQLALSFWLLVVSAMLVNVSLGLGSSPVPAGGLSAAVGAGL